MEGDEWFEELIAEGFEAIASVKERESELGLRILGVDRRRVRKDGDREGEREKREVPGVPKEMEMSDVETRETV